jgi:hypothetical protein
MSLSIIPPEGPPLREFVETASGEKERRAGKEMGVKLDHRSHMKNDSRPLSRVNVISVCQLSVAKTGSIFFASSSRSGDDTVRIMSLISSFTKMARKKGQFQ